MHVRRKGRAAVHRGEVDEFGKKSAKVIARIFDAAWELNAFRNGH